MGNGRWGGRESPHLHGKDDWSPEAREAAAKARKSGSSGPKPQKLQQSSSHFSPNMSRGSRLHQRDYADRVYRARLAQIHGK